MKVIEYQFEFVLDKAYVAHCSQFKGWANYPQIHVWTMIGEEEKVFNFYKCTYKIFWFELPVEDEKMAYAIASVLGIEFNLRVGERQGIQKATLKGGDFGYIANKDRRTNFPRLFGN